MRCSPGCRKWLGSVARSAARTRSGTFVECECGELAADTELARVPG
jgi:hypothetical protein